MSRLDLFGFKCTPGPQGKFPITFSPNDLVLAEKVVDLLGLMPGRMPAADLKRLSMLADRSQTYGRFLVGEPSDRMSRLLFCLGFTNKHWDVLHEAVPRLERILGPLCITSLYRNSGTHEFAAIDLVPYIVPAKAHLYASLRNPARPLLLYARPAVVRAAVEVMNSLPRLTMAIEDNHFHIHVKASLPQHILSSIPAGPVLLKAERKGYASPEDHQMSGVPGIYGLPATVVEPSGYPRVVQNTIKSHTVFSRRFS